MYMIGNGDCGQLGMGEDVTDKLRPGILELPDEKQARAHFLDCRYGRCGNALRLQVSTLPVRCAQCTAVLKSLACSAGIGCCSRWYAHIVHRHG